MKKILFLLYRDLDFDGRAARMIEVARPLGQLHVLDMTLQQGDLVRPTGRRSVRLQPSWSPLRRHWTVLVATLREARRLRPDMIVAENFFSVFTGWLAARMLGVPLVYDSYELMQHFPQEPVSRQARFWCWLERRMARYCDLVIAANPERAALMQEACQLREMPEAMRNIPMQSQATSTVASNAAERFPILRKANEEERIILYQGDLRFGPAVGRFIDVLDHLPAHYRLVIVGDGPSAAALAARGERFAREGRFAMLGKLPVVDLPQVTAYADLGLVTYPFDVKNHYYAAPNKLYEYSMSGVPVLVSNTPSLAAVTQELQHGLLFDADEDAKSLALKVEKAMKIRLDAEDFCRRIADERDSAMLRVRKKMAALLNQQWLAA
ncbi:glycosyltransferase [Novosphingobium umbonatum]|uniref:Glycosyltransferase n=1 Tax=Novosphingobium umbonatum TaxID=1908524 RepID=A0A437N2U2_9SPHN|nr:glycosyltransferase [Novosphingobium umbonatum]RVU04247.1 glycosyltransferase [Novosphingobium umbonatum]